MLRPTIAQPFVAFYILDHANQINLSFWYCSWDTQGREHELRMRRGEIAYLILGDGGNARVDVLREVRGARRHEVVLAKVLDSIEKNKVCLKGGLATPMGDGACSLDVQPRKELDLYASLVKRFPGLPTCHDNVDIVVIRENTEGEYSGLEHEVLVPDVDGGALHPTTSP
ncbi:Isocitrate dehydrogenase [NAD] regulatory subunit 1, mitochondrial, partial [Mucuna pruriens]